MSLYVYLEDPTAKYKTESLYWANITHNLGEMADKAGIYKALWRPEEIGAKYAKDIIEIVEKGLSDLKARPEYFEQFNSPVVPKSLGGWWLTFRFHGGRAGVLQPFLERAK